MSGLYGHQIKVMVGTASPPTRALDVLVDGVRRTRTIVDLNGLKGTRSRYAARARPSLLPVGGALSLYPTPVELSTLLPLILGGTPSGTSYPLAETLPTFNYWSARNSQIYKYAQCGVSRATFSARQGEGLLLSMDIVGTTEDSATSVTSFPAFAIDTTTKPFMFHELLLTVDGEEYQCKSFSLTIDNAIDPSRFFNSQSLASVQPTDRVIKLSHDLPFGDSEAAFGLDQTGVQAVLTFTSGAASLAMTMPLVQYEDETPTAADRGEVMFPMTGDARASANLNELAVVLDSTP